MNNSLKRNRDICYSSESFAKKTTEGPSPRLINTSTPNHRF